MTQRDFRDVQGGKSKAALAAFRASAMSNSQQGVCFPKVAVIILNYNNPQLTAQCIETFMTVDYPNFEIFIIDNGSTDDSLRLLQRYFPDLPLVCTGANRGYSGGNNEGIKYALANKAAYVLIVNNDTEVMNRRFLHEMIVEMTRDTSVGIIGPKVLNPGGRVQDTILYTPTLRNCIKSHFLRGFPRYDYNVAQEVEVVSGVCWLIRAEVFRTVGLLDDDYFMYVEEQDYCYRARKVGWEVKYLPVSSILHQRASDSLQSILRRYVYSRKNLVWFQRKHFGLFPALVLAVLIMASNILRVALWAFRRKHSTERALYNVELLRALASELAAALRRHS